MPNASTTNSKRSLSSLLHGYLDLRKNSLVQVSAKQNVLMFVAGIIIFFIVSPSQSLNNFSLLIFFSPIWVPGVLIYPTIIRYIQANRVTFISKQKFVLLELLIPREVTKTPLAMETFFSNLHIGSGEGTNYQKYVQGSVRPWWSFEIVSLGGRVHFYIWTRVGFRRLIESSLYSQYPDMQIIEAEDYSRITDPSDADHQIFGAEYAKGKPDPFPIKSYIDFGLTPGSKPEENVDPLAQVVELLGSIGPEEQVWLQFIIRTTKDEKLHKKTADGKAYTWRDQAVDLIDDLRTKLSQKGQYIDPVTGKLHETKIGNLTKGQTDTINSIERNITKQGFDTGIRVIYSAKKDAFQPGMIGPLLNIFKPFNNESNNTIGPNPSVWSPSFSGYPWEDRSGYQHQYVNSQVTRLYRQRAFYHLPYVSKWMVLSTEELATIYHIPTSGVSTPNLQRIQSTTSGAPANLPQ
jgi:hypothetical protein